MNKQTSDRPTMFRMPAHFGPTPGPRQLPPGHGTAWTIPPVARTVRVTCGTDGTLLAGMLPDGFELAGDWFICETTCYSELEWLAGGGYSTLGIKIPARYSSGDCRHDPVDGLFLAVLFENLADPILSGREELGFNKLYCEIEEARTPGRMERCRASWLGHHFFELEVDVSAAAPGRHGPDAGAFRPTGLLHHKYIPRTGAWGAADIDQVTYTAFPDVPPRVESQAHGTGAIKFHEATWRELPTLHHVVNSLAALPVADVLSAGVVVTRGGSDLSHTRIIDDRLRTRSD